MNLNFLVNLDIHVSFILFSNQFLIFFYSITIPLTGIHNSYWNFNQSYNSLSLVLFLFRVFFRSQFLITLSNKSFITSCVLGFVSQFFWRRLYFAIYWRSIGSRRLYFSRPRFIYTCSDITPISQIKVCGEKYSIQRGSRKSREHPPHANKSWFTIFEYSFACL